VTKQYAIKNDNEATATVEGWMTRRWDAAVQARLHKLFFALGKEFDGKIAGINLAETSFEAGTSGCLFPSEFSFEIYRDGIIANMKALKQVFPQSVTMQYANFMPGEWLPHDDKGYLKSVYQAASSLNVGVGGPDLLPFRPGQLNHSYPLLKAAAGIVPVGIAVQEGNYTSQNPKTGKRVTVPELLKFATDTLNVDYIFWCTEKPFFAREVVPLLKRI
jgi:hypothetical protein